MISTIVLDAPAGIGGPGRVRASGHLRSTALPWVALLARAGEVTGGAMTTGTGVRGAELPSIVLPAALAAAQRVAGEPFATTHPYSTLGNHSPGRPKS